MTDTFSTRKMKPWNRALLALVVYELLSFGFLMPMVFILGENATETAINVLRVIFGLVATLVYVFIAKKVDRRDASVLSLGIHPGAIKGFLVGTALAGMTVLAGAWISNTFFASSITGFDDRSWANLPSIICAAYFLQGLPEEVAFRAYMPQTLEAPPHQNLHHHLLGLYGHALAILFPPSL